MIKNWLNDVRKPNKDSKVSRKILHSLLILVAGIILGTVSKWLDNLSIDDTIWWQHLLGILNLNNIFSEFGVWIFLATTIAVCSSTPLRAGLNVFLFFIGMNVSYHLYTIHFCGFNPRNHMLIWYGITLTTPLFAVVCWYAKGKGKIAIAVSAGILAVMMLVSFGIGVWYFCFRSVIDTILFAGTIEILRTTPIKSLYSLGLAIILAFGVRMIL